MCKSGLGVTRELLNPSFSTKYFRWGSNSEEKNSLPPHHSTQWSKSANPATGAKPHPSQIFHPTTQSSHTLRAAPIDPQLIDWNHLEFERGGPCKSWAHRKSCHHPPPLPKHIKTPSQGTLSVRHSVFGGGNDAGGGGRPREVAGGGREAVRGRVQEVDVEGGPVGGLTHEAAARHDHGRRPREPPRRLPQLETGRRALRRHRRKQPLVQLVLRGGWGDWQVVEFPGGFTIFLLSRLKRGETMGDSC